MSSALFWPRDAAKYQELTLCISDGYDYEKYLNAFCIYYGKRFKLNSNKDVKEFRLENDIAFQRNDYWEYAGSRYDLVWAQLSLPTQFDLAKIMVHPNVTILNDNGERIVLLSELKGKLNVE